MLWAGGFLSLKIVMPHGQHLFNDRIKVRLEEHWLSSWKQLFGTVRKRFP